MTNVTCSLKVTREIPTGLLRFSTDIIWINDAFLRFALFYRYTGGYRPYLIDFSVNFCELVKKSNYILENPIVYRLVKGVKNVYPALLSGCPYSVSTLYSIIIYKNNDKNKLRDIWKKIGMIIMRLGHHFCLQLCRQEDTNLFFTFLRQKMFQS